MNIKRPHNQMEEEDLFPDFTIVNVKTTKKDGKNQAKRQFKNIRDEYLKKSIKPNSNFGQMNMSKKLNYPKQKSLEESTNLNQVFGRKQQKVDEDMFFAATIYVPEKWVLKLSQKFGQSELIQSIIKHSNINLRKRADFSRQQFLNLNSNVNSLQFSEKHLISQALSYIEQNKQELVDCKIIQKSENQNKPCIQYVYKTNSKTISQLEDSYLKIESQKQIELSNKLGIKLQESVNVSQIDYPANFETDRPGGYGSSNIQFLKPNGLTSRTQISRQGDDICASFLQGIKQVKEIQSSNYLENTEEMEIDIEDKYDFHVSFELQEVRAVEVKDYDKIEDEIRDTNNNNNNINNNNINNNNNNNKNGQYNECSIQIKAVNL